MKTSHKVNTLQMDYSHILLAQPYINGNSLGRICSNHPNSHKSLWSNTFCNYISCHYL